MPRLPISNELQTKEHPYAFMTDPERYFVILTHRLRDVGATIHEYDEHFWRNGHFLQIVSRMDLSQVQAICEAAS